MIYFFLSFHIFCIDSNLNAFIIHPFFTEHSVRMLIIFSCNDIHAIQGGLIPCVTKKHILKPWSLLNNNYLTLYYRKVYRNAIIINKGILIFSPICIISLLPHVLEEICNLFNF